MLHNSRFVSGLLAFLVALISVSFLSLLPSSNLWELALVAVMSFSSAFFLFYFTLEFLVFKEINRLYEVVEKLKKKELKVTKRKTLISLNPISRLNNEIHSLVSKKQKEIKQLKKLELYRREFLADVSHELKTPIFAAQGYIHTLLDGAVDDLEVRDKFLRKAAKSLDSLNKLVQDLLTLSKMEAGVLKITLEPIDFAELVRNAFEKYEQMAIQHTVTLDFIDETNGNAWINADAYRMLLAISNLIENGIKYGKENGHVEALLQRRGGMLFFEIKDDGIGIPSEHIDRIFERFYRIDRSRTKERGGSGLGLSIVKQILKLHQVDIQVKSKPKKGTIFSFEIQTIAPPAEKPNSLNALNNTAS